MTTRIKLRRDTAANWATNNPVLALGEPGLETDTNLVKYGDGVTAWNSLTYATGTPTQQDQFILMIANGEADFPLVASSSFDGINWISPLKTSAYNGSGQGTQQFSVQGVPAIGKGKIVYVIEFESDVVYYGLAWADNIEQAPNRILDQCTFLTADQHQYAIQWNNVVFSGEYFIAVGSYYDGSNHRHPYFVYSADGVHWSPGNIDQTYIASLISANDAGGNDNATGLLINDAESNGQGWLLSFAWTYNSGSGITPHYAGGFYIPTLATQLNSGNYISTLPVTDWGYTGWLGSSWLGYDYSTNTVHRNPNTNPGQGSWTTTDLSTIVTNTYGNISFSPNWIEWNANGQAVVLSYSQYLYTTDSGATWHGGTLAPFYDLLTAVGSGNASITTTNPIGNNNGGNNIKVTITGLPSGTFASGDYFLGGVDGSTASLYSDEACTQHVTSSGTFSTITVTAAGKLNGNVATVSSTTGITVGMSIYSNGNEFNGPTFQPWIITAVDTVNNTVTLNQIFLTAFSSSTWTIGPTITYSSSYFEIVGAIYDQGKWVMALTTMGPTVMTYSSDLVNWNYSIGMTSGLNWQKSSDEFANFIVGLSAGSAGVANNILISNNSAWQPGFTSGTSAISGLANSLSIGNGLQADMFGFASNYDNLTGDPIRQELYFNPDYAWWQIGQSSGYTIAGSPNLNFESTIGSFDYLGQGDAPDIAISLSKHNVSTYNWIFTNPGTANNPSQFLIPEGGSIGLDDSGTPLNVLSVQLFNGNNYMPNIAIGPKAGPNPTDGNTIAIGYEAGQTSQAGHAIAIGARAGKSGQGDSAIAIGASANGPVGSGGTAQSANSIVINAQGYNTPLYDAGQNTLVIKPIRNATGPTSLYYDSSTGEITYHTSSSGASLPSNAAGFLYNIGDGTLEYTMPVASSGSTGATWSPDNVSNAVTLENLTVWVDSGSGNPAFIISGSPYASWSGFANIAGSGIVPFHAGTEQISSSKAFCPSGAALATVGDTYDITLLDNGDSKIYKILIYCTAIGGTNNGSAFIRITRIFP